MPANSLAKAQNRLVFAAVVVATGALAGAFVWLVVFTLGMLTGLLWGEGAEGKPPVFVVAVCVAGGLAIGVVRKLLGFGPQELTQVIGQVKQTGRYSVPSIPGLAASALLPLVFGGAVGPEAGLTGVIAATCTKVGDRLRRVNADFAALANAGTMAALSAVFTAPLFGFASAFLGWGAASDEESLELPSRFKGAVYLLAVASAVGAAMALKHAFGGGLEMPHFDLVLLEGAGIAWAVAAALLALAAGWLYCVLDVAFERASSAAGDHVIAKPLAAGLILGVAGCVLPLVMFSGEAESALAYERAAQIGGAVLLAAGFAKVVLTPLCIRFGWMGGHFFPLIFAGMAIGLGVADLAGVGSGLCVAASTGALLGVVMRQPVLAALLLLLCFPVRVLPVVLCCAALGALLPLPCFARRAGLMAKK